MKHVFKTFFTLLTLMAVFSMTASAQTNEEPIITIHSDAYNQIGEGNKFSILLSSTEKEFFDIDLGAGLNEVEVEPATINPETGEWVGTWVPCRVDKNGLIRIYGDASKIDVIVADGAYITEIDMEKCTNLEILSLEHNALHSLDLTPFTKLFAIYLSDNPFTAETPLKVGAPKPNLQILEIDIIEHLDQSFNLSDYPALVTFDGYHNTDLWNLDPTGCPNLRVLSAELSNISTLDVSQNPQLMRLNIADTRITSIDITRNTHLQHLLAGHASGTINTEYKLREIDLSGNPELVILNLEGNGMTDIDLSHNPLITNLYLQYNNLTSLDLSANKQLYSIDVMYNNMTFATLPLPQNTWGEYFYTQRPVSVPRAVQVNTPIDLSASVLREGTVTSAKVFRKVYGQEDAEIPAEEYSYENGLLTLKTVGVDSLYASFSNDVFFEYPVTTTPFLVKNAADMGQPTRIISFSLASEMRTLTFSAGLDGATAEAPRQFIVELPDGTRTNFTATASTGGEVNVSVPGQTSGMYSIYIPEGEVLTSFVINNAPLSYIDVTAATELRELEINGCGIYYINLAYNRCLTRLSLQDNNLSELDLQGVYGNYEKNVLSYVNASHNNLTSCNIIATTAIRHLDLSYNRFAEFSLKNFDNVDVLDMSHNLLAGEFSVAYLAEASSINLSDNAITALQYDGFNRLETFNVSNNKLTLATLPDPATLCDGFIYAPQSKLQLEENAPAVNLSEQNRVINGTGTTFTWKKADGTVLVNGVDIECINGGTRFLKEDLGLVYCEMTNPAFPQLSGQNVFETTQVNVVGAPSKIVATFTTLEDAYNGTVIFTGAKKTALYIDWRGDGTEFTPYPVETSYISYPGQRTFAGANVKVYTYDEATDITVFSINDMKLADMDASPMTNLIMLAANGAGLDDGKLIAPETETMTELSLSGNNLTAYPFFDRYPRLYSLNLEGNLFTTFDASRLPGLELLNLNNNKLTEVKFNNPSLWSLGLANNQLESVSLQGLPALYQVLLNNNSLSTIDLSPVKNTLYVLYLTDNRFSYATLPVPADYPRLVYYYGNQKPLEVECVDGKVDLSAQANAGGKATAFDWYLGEALFDSDEGVYTGELLIADDEYVITDGVTEFLTELPDKVMCVMSNEAFPDLLLTTALFTPGVSSSSIDSIAGDSNATVDVYNLQGIRVRHSVAASGALRGLVPGIYIVNGKKYIVR